MNIVGRKQELKELQDFVESKQSEFLVLSGRRVGKTFLIREFFQNEFAFQTTGVYNGTREVELCNFALSLAEYSGKETPTPKSWLEAFHLLRQLLEDQKQDNQPQIVFIDELPWMDTHKSDLLTGLEAFWNGWAAWQHNIKLIVCDSATSWISDNIINNMGGLYNRMTRNIFLKPFNLSETEIFLKNKGIDWSRYDITECYMILGGIPYYLNLLQREKTYQNNIDVLFFKTKSKLWNEYEQLYRTLFKNSSSYIKVVETLAEKKIGLTRNEIISKTKLSNNGVLKKILQNLVQCDFIRPYNYYGNIKRETTYQLSDYYTLFYLRFVKDNYGVDEHFWTNTLDNPSRKAWAGYAFEQVCKDHLSQIKRQIGISAVLSEYSSWYSHQKQKW